MANPQNVEMEAARFLHRLIQESRDEPTKLATKLYVILQHMRSSGKENSMPYQVISRAMETVIKDHNLDIESLMSSRLPLTAGAQMGDSASSQLAGSSQRAGAAKDSKPSFSGNEMGTPETYASTRVHTGPACGGPDIYQGSPASAAEPANRMQFGNSSFDGQGFVTKTSKDRSMEVFSSVPSGDHSAVKGIAGKTLDHGGSSMAINANKGSSSSSLSEPNVLRASVSMDTGKSPICQSSSPVRPFNDQQLKQLRAQCLVFLAFRNGLMPKKLHLEIALGNIYNKEDGSRRDLVDQKGKEQLVNDQGSVPQIPRSLERPDSSKGCPSILNSYSSKEVDFAKLSEARSSRHAVPAENEQDRKNPVARGKSNAEELTHEAKELHAYAQLESHDSSTREILNHNHEDDSGNTHQPSAVLAPREQLKLEESGGSGNGFPNDIHKAPLQTNFVTNDAVLHTKDDAKSHTQNPVDSNSLGKIDSDKKLPSNPLKDQWKPVAGMSGQNYDAVPIMDSNMMVKNVSQGVDQEEDYTSISTERQSSPKHTTIEGWILERQKRKVLTERNWAHKQQKTEQRIAASSDKLKEIVSSSEDISAKTKSVIELKKLQLLDLQRRLRSDILNDFFKPIASEMDKLKSIKKHRIGRRSKQIERYEQRMKEERLKRIRERQKEFFSELEVHRERLEDGFKIKKERWKGLNRYVREFHKRKERFHREKIDRIQREKINLLKINDVEGYLRMVQDAKSDRVDKLLKETEKYLQKLGSKLKDAKAMARQFESDMEETKGFVEENEDSVENEDEKDQAKHYLESNEKYYLMAHSVKENIIEQPASLIGGKLREYQMNGLRWLVSLYNNHLNGILADEMGLGKTVQVISLICYLMETKNDRGPFLVVVPSSVLPGWESEMKFWAPSIHRIIYSGPPEERRRLFKEHIVHQKFNVLLTTYEYLMNKHDRPKLSKIQWHYVIIDEGHRIKNASCKLNADLKHYRSNHRLLLTGTPLQNNLEELWALLNFLLPNIFNSSDDFSQWFNKPFESNGDNSPDEASLLSEEENLLIINRLHQVLRPFVLRRLKHKVENELPEKIERLVRCEASSYQKLLMKRVEDNLGAIGTSKARTVHNSVMELRNICNHPYLSQLHVEEVHDLIPKHYLPNVVRLCGKLEMLDRLLPKLKATDHRVLLFSTMTRLLDVMEDYLCWKQYRYLRLDGHTSGGDRGGLIERFNNPDSPYFIFLLSIRAGGVGVNLQAADTVIIFDTDWNPQVDLQAQARAHRIGQKKDVLVIRLETVQTVEEQVRASAEHKLGVANQSITAGFFDNNTSAEDRREYLESLLRESKKEEDAPVLDDDSLNDILARSESEIDVFESIDKQRRDEEMVAWQNVFEEEGSEKPMQIPPLPSRLLNDDDLKSFYEVMKISDTPTPVVLPNAGMKRKSGYLGGLDTQQYGRGKRAREVRSYEEQMTEEEFERLCAVETPDSPKVKEEVTGKTSTLASTSIVSTNSPVVVVSGVYAPAVPSQQPQHPTMEPMTIPKKEAAATATETTTATATATATATPTPTPPSKRGRGRPKRVVVEAPPPVPCPPPPGFEKPEVVPKVETKPVVGPSPDSLPKTTCVRSITGSMQELGPVTTNSGPSIPPSVTPQTGRGRGRGRKSLTGGETPVSRRRGKVQAVTLQPVPVIVSSVTDKPPIGEIATSSLLATSAGAVSVDTNVKEASNESNSASHASVVPSCEASVEPSASAAFVVSSPSLASVLPSPSLASVLPSASPASVVLSASPASVVLTASPASMVLSASPASVVLSSSPASVVPSVSGPSVVDARSQVGADSGSAMASGHALLGPVAAASVNQLDPSIVPASNPQANTPLLAGVPSAQSSIPSPPVAVQGRGRGRGRARGRGRGLNAQSQEDTPPPQRRRRRQEPVVSSVPGAVIGQDSALSEPPRKRTRASGGRKDSVIGERNHDLTNASQYAVAQDIKGPSADQVPKGTDTGEEKFADPPQEQTTNEKEGKDHSNKVLSSNSNSDGLSPVLTLDPPAKILSALSKPVHQSARESGESNDQKGHDNQDSREDSSLISIPVVFGFDDKHGTSEDPQTLLVINSNSAEMEKNQGLKRSTIEAATTSGSMPLARKNDKSGPLCHNEDDKADFSEESTSKDELPASDNLLKGAADRVFSNSTPGLCDSKNTLVVLADSQSLPVLSNNSVGAAKDQVLHGAKAQDASTLASMPSLGESSNSEPPCVKGGNKITESSEIPNLDESLARDENTSATVETPVSMTNMASVVQPDPASVIASTPEAVAQDIVDPSVNQVPKDPVVDTNAGVDLHQHEGKGPTSGVPASISDSGNQSLGGIGESNDNKGPCVDTLFASTLLTISDKTHGSSEVCQSLLVGESDDDSHGKEDDGNKGPENLSDKIVSENETQKQSSADEHTPAPVDVAAPENLSAGTMKTVPKDLPDKNTLDVEVCISSTEEVSNPSNSCDGAAVNLETVKLVADGRAGENATNCEEVLPETTGNQDQVLQQLN